MTLRDEVRTGNSATRKNRDEYLAWQGAFGGYDCAKVVELVSVNQDLCEFIKNSSEETLQQYESLLPDLEGGYKYSVARLKRDSEKLVRCATGFSRGKPTYVCRLPHLCAFCSYSRANGFYSAYVRAAHAKMSHTDRLRVGNGVIAPYRGCAFDEISEVVSRINQLVSVLRSRWFRTLRHWQAILSKRDAILRAVPQFDVFHHVSSADPDRATEDRMFYPHVHVIFQKSVYWAPLIDVTDKLEELCHEYDLIYKPREALRVSRQPVDNFVHSAVDYGRLASYASVMFKTKMPAQHKFLALLSIKNSFRQVTRSREVAEIPQQFANVYAGDPVVTLRKTGDGFRFQLRR